MTDYYARGVGLTVIGQEGDRVTLGRQGVPSVVLEHTPLLKHAPSSAAGLFHTAILFDQQADLASSVFSVARHFPSSFTGSSDHLVSKALYFDDPEGNGVELYWDRPREQWGWENGRVAMATEYLDPNGFLRENLADPDALDGAAAVGHVHLKVGDIGTAHQFYVDTVGFEVTAEYGTQALFVSAGGYHHHLAMNTWQSRGAQGRWPALGLGEVTIELPTADERGALGARLASRGIAVRDDGRCWPSRTRGTTRSGSWSRAETRSVRDRVRQLGAGAHPELQVHVAQVVLDRLRAEEQRGGGLPRGPPAGEHAGDLQLLRRQVVEAGGAAALGGLAGGAQLGGRLVGPRDGAEPLERRERGPQVRAGVDAALQAAQPGAVGQLGAGGLEVVRGVLRGRRARPRSRRRRRRPGRSGPRRGRPGPATTAGP